MRASRTAAWSSCGHRDRRRTTCVISGPAKAHRATAAVGRAMAVTASRVAADHFREAEPRTHQVGSDSETRAGYRAPESGRAWVAFAESRVGQVRAPAA